MQLELEVKYQVLDAQVSITILTGQIRGENH